MSLPERPAEHSSGGVHTGGRGCVGDGHSEVSPAIHPCLAMDGAALPCQGCLGTGASGEGALKPILQMEVDTGRIGWTQCSSSISNDTSISHSGGNSSLTHLLPTWDAGKNSTLFLCPFLIFVIEEFNLCHRRKIVTSKKKPKGWGSLIFGKYFKINLKKKLFSLPKA